MTDRQTIQAKRKYVMINQWTNTIFTHNIDKQFIHNKNCQTAQLAIPNETGKFKIKPSNSYKNQKMEGWTFVF